MLWDHILVSGTSQPEAPAAPPAATAPLQLQAPRQHRRLPAPALAGRDSPVLPEVPLVPTAAFAELEGPYQMYRVNSTQTQPNLFMDLTDIDQQETELLLSLSTIEEPFFEAEEGAPVCTICMVNSPTRHCSPCGHAVLCRRCLPSFIRTRQFHAITLGDGTVESVNIRLPLTCPSCRAIVEQLIKMY